MREGVVKDKERDSRRGSIPSKPKRELSYSISRICEKRRNQGL